MLEHSGESQHSAVNKIIRNYKEYVVIFHNKYNILFLFALILLADRYCVFD